jgi:hypothetical protein
MMNSSKPGLLMVALPLSALFSAFVQVRWQPQLFGHEDFLGGAVFGALIAICFCTFGRICHAWQIAAFIVISALAAYSGFFVAMLSHELFQSPSPDFVPEAFVGGFIGAFLVLVAIRSLFYFKPSAKSVFWGSFIWASVGGFLGMIGLVTKSLFTSVRMGLAPHSGDSDVSVIFIWQVGMGIAFASMYVIDERSARKGPIQRN